MATTTQSRPLATGGTMFAATIMVLAGIFQLFQGIFLIAKDPIFVTTPNYTLKFSTTSWGWIHLIVGIIVALVGLAVFTGAMWARILAIGIVALQMFSSFFFLPYYPLWSLIVVALDIFIIWSLAVAPSRDSMGGRGRRSDMVDPNPDRDTMIR